jgi:cyanophycinase
MPASIPAGYTRGPIMFIGHIETKRVEAQLLQLFWHEAGSYGARILIVSTSAERQETVDMCMEHLKQWESDSVVNLFLHERNEAMDPGHTALVEAATAIMFVDENLRLAGLLGGTPIAKAIRRANARSKAVCGVGSSAAYLCQHMLAQQTAPSEPQPFMHLGMIQFAPGLGLINQLVLDGDENPALRTSERLARILTATSYNPYLIGLDLGVDAGATVYPDGTMEVFGPGTALVVDGQTLSHVSTHDQAPRLRNAAQSISIKDVKLHILKSEHTFHLGSRTARPPDTSDIPKVTNDVKSAF